MKRLFQYAAALLLLTPALQSCSDDAPSQPSTGGTKITFTQNAEARFAYSRLDTTDGRENQPMAEGRDTVLQTTLNTSFTHKGKTNVIFKQNHYLSAGDKDSLYYWQASDGGDLYQYNFGLDLINSPAVQAIIQQPVEANWVVVAKLGASSGTTWTALDTAIRINAFSLDVNVKSVGKAEGDVKLMINGTEQTVKKFSHKISATNALFGEVANTEMEIYVSTENGGVVRTIRKISNIMLPQTPRSQAIGADFNIVSYTKP